MRRLLPALILLALTGCSHQLRQTPAAPPRASSSQVHENPEEAKKDAARVHTQLAGVYLTQGDKALTFDPQYSDAYTVLGVAYEKVSLDTNAQQMYQKAVDIDPTNGNTQNNLGQFLCTHEQPVQEALSHFQAALNDHFYETPSLAWANEGNCLLRDVPSSSMKSDQRALQAGTDFRKALSIDPNNPFALEGMARLMEGQGNTSQALVFITRWSQAGVLTAKGAQLGLSISHAANNLDAQGRFEAILATDFSGPHPINNP
jgi:type IV pilus assembly protein PilF